MVELTRKERLDILHNWCRMYLYLFLAVFAVFCFLIKGIPGAATIIVLFIVGGAGHFLWRYEIKRAELGFKK